MRILSRFFNHNHNHREESAPRKKQRRISRFKHALNTLQSIPAYDAHPDIGATAKASLEWGKQHLKKSDRFDWLAGLWIRFLHYISDPNQDPNRKKILNKFSGHRIEGDIRAFNEDFFYAFPQLQARAEEHGCRPILDMPFYERVGGRLEPLPPNIVIEGLARLEERHLRNLLSQNRFCTEGEPYMETQDGWKWFLLKEGRSKEEARAMRHCGNIPSWEFGDYIYSLREPVQKNGETFWKPHLTFICNGLRFRELKGFSNRKPVQELHPHIIDLFSQAKFRGFARPGYCSRNDFHVCDLLETQVRKLFNSNPRFQQDDLDRDPEVVCTLPNGWRWIFVPNIRVACYGTHLSQEGLQVLSSLQGRRGWHILQQPVTIQNDITWVHRMVLATRKKHVLNIVRAGALHEKEISEGLFHFMKNVAGSLFMHEVLHWLSEKQLQELIKAKPQTVAYFNLETILELNPPIPVINWYLENILRLSWRLEDSQNIIIKEFNNWGTFMEYLSRLDSWSSQAVDPALGKDGAKGKVRFKIQGLVLEINKTSPEVRILYPLSQFSFLWNQFKQTQLEQTEKSVMNWMLRPKIKKQSDEH